MIKELENNQRNQENTQDIKGECEAIEIEIDKPQFCKLLKFHSDTVTQIAFNPNNKQIISSSNDHSILIWDLATLGTKPKRATGHTSLVHDLAISPTGFYFASASSDETVRLWANTDDISTQDYVQCQVFRHNSAPMKSVDFSCDSRLLCTGSDDTTVKIISIADKKLLANFSGHSNWIKCVRFSRDSRLIASSSDDKSVKLWDVAKRNLAHSFTNEHKAAVNAVRFHPDNSCIATACYDRKVRLFDIRSKQMVQIYPYHAKPVTSISFHPAGMYLASTSYDETIKIYDLRMGDILYTLQAHDGAVTSVSFSPNGEYFASGGLDSLIVLWKSNLEELACRGERIATNEQENIPSPSSSRPFNTETQLNYKNKNMITENAGDNISEDLSKVFEKMVFQLEMVTSTFVNFESRLSKLEEMIDDLQSLNANEANIVQSSIQKEALAKEFISQYKKMKDTMQATGNMINTISKTTNIPGVPHKENVFVNNMSESNKLEEQELINLTNKEDNY